MKIAFLMSSKHLVPPLKTGGIEEATYYLSRELAKKGHQITIFAAPGSKISCVKFKKNSPFFVLSKIKRGFLEERISGFFDNSFLGDFFISRKDEKFDLIQYNGYLFYQILPFAKFSKRPIIIEINYPHKEIYKYLKKEIRKIKNVFYLPVSDFIKTMMPDLPYLPVFTQALDFNCFPLFSKTKKEYLFFLGRICPEKGTHLAIKVAQKARKKLIIAGRIDDSHLSYYYSFVKPHLNRYIRYVGEVDFKTKINLYGKAIATLFPIQWDEPSGLTIMESMACGVPPIIFDRAAAREMVEDNLSGFVVPDGDVDAMARKTDEVNKLNRWRIRRWAENKFSVEKKVIDYEKICQSILNRNIL